MLVRPGYALEISFKNNTGKIEKNRIRIDFREELKIKPDKKSGKTTKLLGLINIIPHPKSVSAIVPRSSGRGSPRKTRQIHINTIYVRPTMIIEDKDRNKKTKTLRKTADTRILRKMLNQL